MTASPAAPGTAPGDSAQDTATPVEALAAQWEAEAHGARSPLTADLELEGAQVRRVLAGQLREQLAPAWNALTAEIERLHAEVQRLTAKVAYRAPAAVVSGELTEAPGGGQDTATPGQAACEAFWAAAECGPERGTDARPHAWQWAQNQNVTRGWDAAAEAASRATTAALAAENRLLRAALDRIAFGDCDSLYLAASIAGDALRAALGEDGQP